MPDKAKEINKTLAKRMRHCYEVDAGQLIESLVDGLGHEDLANVIISIDMMVADVDFTRYLSEHFKEELEDD